MVMHTLGFSLHKSKNHLLVQQNKQHHSKLLLEGFHLTYSLVDILYFAEISETGGLSFIFLINVQALSTLRVLVRTYAGVNGHFKEFHPRQL